MELFWNQFSNGVAFMAVQTVLATEGIKSLALLWGHPLKGKKALAVFVVVMVLSGLRAGGLPTAETYIILSLLRALTIIGLYHAFTRMLDAIGSHKK
jgi:hypothetical protein